MIIVYRAFFISVNELKHCLDLRPGNHPFFFLLAFQHPGKFVVPASFSHEFIPHINLTLGRSMSHPKTRLQNCRVVEAVVHVLDYQLDSTLEKGCAFFVKTFSEVHFIFNGGSPFVVATDFVQHLGRQKGSPAYLVVGTTNTDVSGSRQPIFTNTSHHCKLLAGLHKPLDIHFQPQSVPASHTQSTGCSLIAMGYTASVSEIGIDDSQT